jgi:hypothetical protein
VAIYKYLLGDVLTGDLLAEMPFSTASFSHVLNAPGAFSGTMSLKQKPSKLLELQSAINLGRNTLYVDREGVIVWGGFLWTESANLATAQTTFAGEGFHSYFRRRYIRADKTYTGQDQTTGIAKDLIDYAQGQAGGNIGIITTGMTASGVTRDRSYPAVERKKIGEAIEQLAAVENGFDFRYDSSWNGDVIETKFRTQYPSTGRQTDYVFAVGSHQLTEMMVNVDASTLVVTVDVIGATPDPGTSPLISTVSDTSRLSSMPLLEDIVSFTDVDNTTTLQGHANTRLQRGSQPIVIPSVSFNPSADPVIGSYIPGDIVRVKASVGLKSIDGDFRITEYGVTVSDTGKEDGKMSFASLEVF